mmetsp:Transcript_475/g.1055  ORF Transcript_475/g.1055 Transcript_475/m.1055 type:complete len:284 (+) Transcript_475:39-890(+)
MKINYELCLSGNSCIFVPYRPEHLPNYHEWMQDSFLLEATASEPLTMDQEIEMQREWRDDETKCTFILLARDLIPGGKKSGIPPPPTEKESEISDEKKSYPELVQQTLDAMIGDVNLFLSEEELEESGDEESKQTAQLTPAHMQAELDLMIAAASHRHKNLGTELALMMMHYGAKYLQIRRFFVKIKDTNHSSLKLFKEKLGFVQCAYAECFGEYELDCKCETPEEMVVWVERRWKKNNGLAIMDVDGDGCNGDDQHSGNSGDWDKRPCRMYDVHECPLNSSA